MLQSSPECTREVPLEERVLILTRNHEDAASLFKRFAKFKVDVVSAIYEERKVAFGELRKKFSVIIVDKHFCGNSRATAAFIRRMRRSFFDPIIAVQSCADNEGIFPLTVAGCNFTIPLRDSWEKVCTEVCDLLTRVFPELEREHQQVR